ncbi:MAG: PIN domain-containing protein [Pseudomonadota bacterium]
MLDTSAVLAFFFDEPGADTVEQALPGAAISVVNLGELFGVVRRSGVEASPREVEGHLASAGVSVVSPTSATARLAADYVATPTPRGAASISLADGFCLAHAAEAGVPVLTADRAWAETPFEHPVDIQLVR